MLNHLEYNMLAATVYLFVVFIHLGDKWLNSKPLSGLDCPGLGSRSYFVAQRWEISTVERAKLHWSVLRACLTRSTSWMNSSVAPNVLCNFRGA